MALALSLKPEHLKRYKDVVALFIKYGRSDLVNQTDIQPGSDGQKDALAAGVAKAEELADDLEKLGAPQGAQQMQKLAPLLDNLRAVLNRRLSAGELTYGRYLGAAEQVANSVVDNLRDVDVTLRSIRSIDADAIGERLNHLRRGGGYVGPVHGVDSIRAVAS